MTKIHLAGKPCLIDIDHKIESMIEDRLRSFVWPQISATVSDLPGSPFVNNRYELDRFSLPYSEVPSPRINEFINPTGLSRYGRGMFLVGKEAMAAIAIAAFGYTGDLSSRPASWKAASSPIALALADNDNASSRSVTVLSPILLDARSQTDLWIVPVVDKRYIWGQLSARIEEEEAKSWQSLMTAIALPTGSTITLPAVDSRFTVPDPKSFVESNASPTILADAVALSLGLRLTLSSSDAVIVQQAAAAKSSLESILNSTKVSWGGLSPERTRPSALKVTGPKAKNYVECESWSQDAAVASGHGNAPKLTVHSSIFEHDLPGSVSSASIGVRDALVAAIGESYASWSANNGIITVPGIPTWAVSTLIDYVSIRFAGAKSVTTSAITTDPLTFMRCNYSQWKKHYLHDPDGGSWIFESPAGGVPAGNDEDLGTALCLAYKPNKSQYLEPIEDISGNQIERITVGNMSEAIEDGEFFPAYTVGKMPIHHCCCDEPNSSSDSSSSDSSSIHSSSLSSSHSESSSHSDSSSFSVSYSSSHSQSDPSQSDPSQSDPSDPSGSQSDPSQSDPSYSGSNPPSEPSGSFSHSGSQSDPSSSESDPSSSESDPSGSESDPSGSESDPPSDPPGSDKSNAVVPASWTPGGFAALNVVESPDVRFEDNLTVTMTGYEVLVPIDPHFVEVCQKDKITVCGAVPNLPYIVGASVVDNHIKIVLDRHCCETLTIEIQLTAIRRGHLGKRFQPKTRKQFIENERFIQSSHSRGKHEQQC